MKLQFDITFKQGLKVVGKIKGRELAEGVAERLTVAEVTEKVTETEAFLEKLTGCRVHIEQVL